MCAGGCIRCSEARLCTSSHHPVSKSHACTACAWDTSSGSTCHRPPRHAAPWTHLEDSGPCGRDRETDSVSRETELVGRLHELLASPSAQQPMVCGHVQYSVCGVQGLFVRSPPPHTSLVKLPSHIAAGRCWSAWPRVCPMPPDVIDVWHRLHLMTLPKMFPRPFPRQLARVPWLDVTAAEPSASMRSAFK